MLSTCVITVTGRDYSRYYEWINGKLLELRASGTAIGQYSSQEILPKLCMLAHTLGPGKLRCEDCDCMTNLGHTKSLRPGSTPWILSQSPLPKIQHSTLFKALLYGNRCPYIQCFLFWLAALPYLAFKVIPVDFGLWPCFCTPPNWATKSRNRKHQCLKPAV